MIRIIAVLFVILLIIILLNRFKNKRRSKEKTKELLKYCKYCESYVTDEQKCVNKGFDHRDLD